MALYRRNGKWWIDYRVEGRRKRECIGSSKKLAETVLAKRMTQIAENKFLDIKKESNIRFSQFACEFLEIYSKPNKRSWDRDEGMIKNLNQFFADDYLHDICSLKVEKYKISRSQQVSSATINKEVKLLKSILNRAVEWKKLEANPIVQVKLLKEQHHRLRYLEREEIVKLLKNCSPHLRLIAILALNTGLRRGEIKNLRWQDVDLTNNQICLLEQKNGRKEYVPLNQSSQAVLAMIQKHPTSPYVFCNSMGKTYDWRTAFRNAMRRAGITEFRFHDLRHTFASHLAMSGVDLNTIREIMRHTDFKTTLRYAHLSKDHKTQAVNRLPNMPLLDQKQPLIEININRQGDN